SVVLANDFAITPAIVEHVAELVRPVIEPLVPAEPFVLEATPSLETNELSAAPAEPIEPIEPIIDEYVQELPRNELTEPTVDDSVGLANDFAITPSAPPPPPDQRLAALWDAAAPPTEPETAPLPEPLTTPFVTEDFIADAPRVEIPEAPYPPQEFAPEQAIEYAPPQEFPSPPAEFAPEPPAIVEPAPSFSTLYPELTVADERGLHQIQVVISPIHSFPRLLETERRIRALSTVNALHLRDFRNGVATLTVSVGEAISPAEFGAVIQMLESLHLRLEGTTQSGVE